MSARFNYGLMSSSREFNRLQGKLDNLYDNYNHNSNFTNLAKAAELVEENQHVQNKLHRSMENIAVEGALSRSEPVYCYPKEPLYYPTYVKAPCTSLAQASAAAAAVAATTAAAVNNDITLRRTLSRKNAELCELSSKFKKEISDLECQLNSTRLDNCGLKDQLNNTKKELSSEKSRSTSLAIVKDSDITSLKLQLAAAESELSTLEPKAKLALELENHVCDLKSEIRHVRESNRVLADQNACQAEIIVRSRPASPIFLRSRPTSPVLIRSRPVTPCLVREYSRSPSPYRLSRPTSVCSLSRSGSRIRAVSPMSPNHCTQLIRQDLLVKRFDDLYTRDRLCAMDSLRVFSDNYENNQRVIFSAVQAAFSAAKKAFSTWKIRVRSTVSITHCGPETLEEAVQSYINRNVDLYDLPTMVSEVIIALNCNPKIRLPLGVSYSVISTFIRECCRTAWEMSALAFPLDTAFALDAEVYDEARYRRSYDSDCGAPLVSHHVWPCLMQGLMVLVRGEACTRRGASLYVRPSSPIRCSRPITPTQLPKSILRSRSSYTFCKY